MEQLDTYLGGLAGSGAPLWLTFVIAALLGMRHATDPDHLAAISTLVAKEHAGPGDAARIGGSWGLGHGLAMLLFGLPVILFSKSLPESIYKMAEAAVGVIIIYFAVKLAGQVLSGSYHISPHDHRHPHDHEDVFNTQRSRWKSFGIGMVHGLGGSYGGALLVLATFHSPRSAAIGLVLFSAMAVVSMATVTAAFAAMLTHHRLMHVMSAGLGAFSLLAFAFGLMYLHGAVA